MNDQTIPIEEICEITGLTDRWLRHLAKEGFFPPAVDGKYQLGPTLRGLFKHYRGIHETRAVVADEKMAKLAAERKLAELQLAREQREVLPADDVERAWSYAFSAARGRWLQVPTKAELAFPLWADARACSDWLEEMIRAILKDLAESPDYAPLEEGNDAPSNKAA